MWPFKKKQTAQDTWGILAGEVDLEKTMEQIINHIQTGNYTEVERLTEQLIHTKARQIERDINKN